MFHFETHRSAVLRCFTGVTAVCTINVIGTGTGNQGLGTSVISRLDITVVLAGGPSSKENEAAKARGAAAAGAGEVTGADSFGSLSDGGARTCLHAGFHTVGGMAEWYPPIRCGVVYLEFNIYFQA